MKEIKPAKARMHPPEEEKVADDPDRNKGKMCKS